MKFSTVFFATSCLAIAAVLAVDTASTDVKEQERRELAVKAEESHRNLEQVKAEIATAASITEPSTATPIAEAHNTEDSKSEEIKKTEVPKADESKEVEATKVQEDKPEAIKSEGSATKSEESSIGSRPLILMQQVVRIKERLVVDEQNRPKAFGGEIVKGVYRFVDGHWQRLGLYRFTMQPKPIVAGVEAASASNNDLPHMGKPQDRAVGEQLIAIAVVFVFVFLVALLGWGVAVVIERVDAKRKRDQEYRKLLRVPTSEHMAMAAPRAPTYA